MRYRNRGYRSVVCLMSNGSGVVVLESCMHLFCVHSVAIVNEVGCRNRLRDLFSSERVLWCSLVFFARLSFASVNGACRGSSGSSVSFLWL